MRIELSQEEVDLLRELLARANADLREEVYRTEAAAWKRALKTQERVLQTLIEKLASL